MADFRLYFKEISKIKIFEKIFLMKLFRIKNELDTFFSYFRLALNFQEIPLTNFNTMF